MGVLSRLPYTPPFEIVNVPPAISSMERVPVRAFSPSSLIFFSMPAKPSLSASRRTGTTRPCQRQCRFNLTVCSSKDCAVCMRGLRVSNAAVRGLKLGCRCKTIWKKPIKGVAECKILRKYRCNRLTVWRK